MTAAAREAEFTAIAEWERYGDTPLVPGAREAANGRALRVAFVVPSPVEGRDGKEETILNLARLLGAGGHDVSLWVQDQGGMRGPGQFGFDGWSGADVAVAAGWQTVHSVLMLGDCKARAYLVHDHEPDFYAESAERRWAEQTYRLGLHCITAGRWLRDLVTQNYGATASWFSPGVDTGVYYERGVPRAHDVVLGYAPPASPRRAVPLLLLALAELKRRRPDVQIELFGDGHAMERLPGARELGFLDHNALAEAYSRATVGVVLSLTNYSAVAEEMLACGLACVEADTSSTRLAFGRHRPVSLAAVTVGGVAGAVEQLLEDPALRAKRRHDGLEFISGRTWESAAEDFEAGLREALRLAAE
jgi:glycosyltransferase involved in cell wall biosynthesis